MPIARILFAASVQAVLAAHNTRPAPSLVSEVVEKRERLGGFFFDKEDAAESNILDFHSKSKVTEATTAIKLEEQEEQDPPEALQLSFDTGRDAVAVEAGGITPNFTTSLKLHRKRHQSSATEAEAEMAKHRPSLVYIKIPKTGGSTLGGICRRIGARRNYSHVQDAYWLRNHQNLHPNASVPSVWANHGKRHSLQSKINKAMPDAFYLTSVREPAERCMAAYYHFTVGRRGVDANNTARKLIHIRKCSGSFETSCMRSTRHQTVAEIFRSFNFVLITDRFDESLLALRKAVPWLELTYTDLLYLKAKESGQAATDHVDHFKMPSHVPLSEEPVDVRKALAERWVGSDDETILRLAHKKLDRYKIKHSKELKHFQSMLRTVENHCRAHFREDCLWNDNGCGQACIDRVAKRHGWS